MYPPLLRKWIIIHPLSYSRLTLTAGEGQLTNLRTGSLHSRHYNMMQLRIRLLLQSKMSSQMSHWHLLVHNQENGTIAKVYGQE